LMKAPHPSQYNLPWADSTRRPKNLPGLNGMRETTTAEAPILGFSSLVIWTY
jgi:hypothetical protein